MAKYILKRLVQILPVLLGISFIIFFILDMTPGDPARLILGQTANAEAVEQLREEMGLNDPFFVRYFKYLTNVVLHFDFGESYRTSQPVFTDILSRLPTSLGLASCGMVASLLFGLPLGILSRLSSSIGRSFGMAALALNLIITSVLKARK